MSLFSTFRDPFRSTFEDVFEVDPWLTTTTMPADRSRVRRAASSRMISCDTFETDQEFKVICECPGVPKEKIDVNVDNFLLTIRVNKQAPDYSNAYNMTRNELVYGNDQRSIRIPANCAQDPSHCSFKDGCLCISFPKSGEKEGKKLQIESS